jgi:hypothetical protein
MNDEDQIANAVVEHGGWIAAIVTALGMWILKSLLSSQFKILLEEHRQLQTDVNILMTDMATVKAVIRERDGKGVYTWPGDKR